MRERREARRPTTARRRRPRAPARATRRGSPRPRARRRRPPDASERPRSPPRRGRAADPDRRRERRRALGGLAGDEAEAGAGLREAARVGAYVPAAAVRQREHVRCAPSSSTISNAAVFWPSSRSGLSEFTRTCVPRSASVRAARAPRRSHRAPRARARPSARACASFPEATAPSGWRTTATSPARAAYAAADAAVFPVDAQITVVRPPRAPSRSRPSSHVLEAAGRVRASHLR